MPPHSKPTLIAFGLGLAYLAAYQQFKLPPVLPVLLETYRYDRTLAGGLMSVYAVAGLLLSWGLGRSLSRQGLAGPIQIGLGLMVLGSLLTLALPAQAWMVLLGRALEGAGFAVLAIAGPVLANANASARLLPIVVGLTAAWIPVGQLGATALAPLAFAGPGWRMLWFVAIAVSLAMALWTWRLRRRGALEVAMPDAGAAGDGAAPELSRAQRRCRCGRGARGRGLGWDGGGKGGAEPRKQEGKAGLPPEAKGGGSSRRPLQCPKDKRHELLVAIRRGHRRRGAAVLAVPQVRPLQEPRLRLRAQGTQEVRLQGGEELVRLLVNDVVLGCAGSAGGRTACAPSAR